MKRLNFVLGTSAGFAVVASAGNVFTQALAQAPLPGLPGAENRCLVIVNLYGGNDGLNCIVPHGDPRYYQLRPTLGLAHGEVLPIDGQIGFNATMAPLKALYDKGMVAVVQSVGYPNTSYSHFRSTEIWQTAAPDRYEHTGWLGRYFDEAGFPESDLFKGVSVSRVLPEALASNHTDIPALPSPAQYRLAVNRSNSAGRAYTEVVNDRNLPFTSPYLARVMEIEGHAQRGSQELPGLIAGYKSEATYPDTPIGKSLALAAQIVGSKLDTKVIYVEHGSFDTHVSQKGLQNRLLGEFSTAMAAFYTDLAAHGNDKRVLTMTFSEFGRRIAENGSRGTDHGEASPLFLIGGGVKGGLYGSMPDLGTTDLGNVRFTTDFRSVYATVLERWLGRPSDKVLRGAFPTIPAIA
jgi:uncharacterized protein (DUF1501 family)